MNKWRLKDGFIVMFDILTGCFVVSENIVPNIFCPMSQSTHKEIQLSMER